jgi:hypothetical protein
MERQLIGARFTDARDAFFDYRNGDVGKLDEALHECRRGLRELALCDIALEPDLRRSIEAVRGIAGRRGGPLTGPEEDALEEALCLLAAHLDPDGRPPGR